MLLSALVLLAACIKAPAHKLAAASRTTACDQGAARSRSDRLQGPSSERDDAVSRKACGWRCRSRDGAAPPAPGAPRSGPRRCHPHHGARAAHDVITERLFTVAAPSSHPWMAQPRRAYLPTTRPCARVARVAPSASACASVPRPRDKHVGQRACRGSRRSSRRRRGPHAARGAGPGGQPLAAGRLCARAGAHVHGAALVGVHPGHSAGGARRAAAAVTAGAPGGGAPAAAAHGAAAGDCAPLRWWAGLGAGLCSSPSKKPVSWWVCGADVSAGQAPDLEAGRGGQPGAAAAAHRARAVPEPAAEGGPAGPVVVRRQRARAGARRACAWGICSGSSAELERTRCLAGTRAKHMHWCTDTSPTADPIRAR